MTRIMGRDAAGNAVQFEADAQPVEADATTTAETTAVSNAAAKGALTSSTMTHASLTLTGALTAASAAINGALTGLTTLVASGLATVQSLKLDTGTKTATAASGAATLNKSSGIITSEALTTAAGATYTLTLTNSQVAATDQVFAFVNLGAGTGGTPAIASVAPAAGSVVIVVQNIHASAAFNAAIKIGFAVLKA